MTYTYDVCQRLKEEWVTDARGVTLAKYSYGLGKAGERLTITESAGASETETTYQYDKLNRLVKEVISKDGNELTNEYSYDKVSNRISKETKVKGELSALADIDSQEVQVEEGCTTYTYNALNQLVTEESPEGSITYTYDANGNLVKQSGSKTVDYSYDKENHLLRATIQQGNSVTVESYTCDYAGNRLSKTVNESSTTYYVNDTSGSLTQVVAETDKDGKETASYTRGDELLSMERGGEIWYYIYDGHGSTRLLTNEAGRITDRYTYDACGNLLEKEGDTENDFLYTGEQYNANPVMYTDPTGNMAYAINMAVQGELSISQVAHDMAIIVMGLKLIAMLRDSLAFHNATVRYNEAISSMIESGEILENLDVAAEKVKEQVIAATKEETKQQRNYTVYTLVDKEGIVRYVGRTNNYERRMKEHEQPGGKIYQYDLLRGTRIDNLTKEQARGLEQSLIVLYNTANFLKDPNSAYYNFVNGISPKNGKSDIYHEAAKEYMNQYPSMFENFLEEELNAIKEDSAAWW